MRRAFVILLFLLAGSSVFACNWDRDTLRVEAEGMPDAFQAIIGRFERNPALYYEMRLERVARDLEMDPTQLALYDDAGVACDRLGRGDEAIDWMERKRALLAELESDSDLYREHQYRYLANIGTFHAHRWFRNGADFDRPDDLEAAVSFIQEAIDLNPDAHFGRERYQLMALEWVMSKPEMHQEYPGEFPGFLKYLLKPDEMLSAEDADEVMEGLTGLIMLGDAWNSFDVFFALGQTLQRKGDALLALMAWQRCLELANDGRGSIVRGTPEDFFAYYGEESGTEFAEYMFGSMVHFGVGRGPSVYLHTYQAIKEEYVRQRENAEAWYQHRTNFMMARLEAGQHPDTHEDFWATYEAVPELKVRQKNLFIIFGAIVLCVGSMLAIGRLIAVRRKLRASKI